VTVSLEDLLSRTITVSVEYYDDKHKEQLLKYPDVAAIAAVAGHEIQIPVEEFLKYFIFHDARHRPSLMRDPSSKRNELIHAHAMATRYLTLDGGAVRISEGIVSLPNHVIEYIGESIGLAVASRIHDLNESDWLPIDVQRGAGKKTLDFETGSDGKRIVQLEAKGTVVADVDKKSSSVPNHRADIEKKKAAQAPRDSAIVRYGTIAAIPKESQNLRCWLLDPEPVSEPLDPRRLRLLARLNFLRWILWLIAPRSILATALGSRIKAVEMVANPFELSRVPLTDASGTVIEIEYPVSDFANIPTFFTTRSHVSDGPAGGIVIGKSADTLLFVAFREDLLHLAAKQDFENLLNYSASADVIWKDVRCVLRNAQLRRMNIDVERLPNARRGETETWFDLAGRLVYTPEGLVFGELPIGRDERRRS
jgi:hypothetical protein